MECFAYGAAGALTVWFTIRLANWWVRRRARDELVREMLHLEDEILTNPDYDLGAFDRVTEIRRALDR